MEQVYKIRLKGTCLFYQPTKGRWNNEKSNLSERGKIYEKKPNLKDYTGFQNISQHRHEKYGIGFPQIEKWRRDMYGLSVSESHLEVVTYNVVEA